MNRVLAWVWKHGIVSNFLAGLFVILPLVLTIVVVTWVASYVRAFIGDDTPVGGALRSIGLHFVSNDFAASVIGWCLVLGGVWLLGLAVKAGVLGQVQAAFNALMLRIPIIKQIYGTAAHMVGLLEEGDGPGMQAMCTVYCSFGKENGCGFLALLASPDVFQFAGEECRVVYLPTSPIPMTGGLLFVPKDKVIPVPDMPADKLMQMYVSLGVLTSQMVPENFRVQQVEAAARAVETATVGAP